MEKEMEPDDLDIAKHNESVQRNRANSLALRVEDLEKLVTEKESVIAGKQSTIDRLANQIGRIKKEMKRPKVFTDRFGRNHPA
jgi:hypothetical protein